MGTSAGAGGTAAQYAKLRQKFITEEHPNRQIHLIEDSTPSVSIQPDHWNNMATWQTKIPGLPCTPPPNQPPPPDSGFASLSSLQSRRAGPPKTKRLVLPSTARTAETSGADSDDYPTGLAYPFPPEYSTSTPSARRTASNTILGATESALDKPRSDTCYYLNETRIFNRSLDSNFRYSILSFQWDNVLPPKKTQAGYELYFSRMSANDSAVEQHWPVPPYNLNTKHLYLDNTTQQQTAVPNDPQGTLCGRHVPTNFNIEPLDPPNKYTQVQDAHYDFISGMVIGDSSWATNDGLLLTRCPKDVSDVSPTSF